MLGMRGLAFPVCVLLATLGASPAAYGQCELLEHERNIVQSILHPKRVELLRHGRLVAHGEELRRERNFIPFRQWRGVPDRWSGRHEIDHQASRYAGAPEPHAFFNIDDIPVSGWMLRGTGSGDVSILGLDYVNRRYSVMTVRLEYMRAEPLKAILSDISCLAEELAISTVFSTERDVRPDTGRCGLSDGDRDDIVLRMRHGRRDDILRHVEVMSCDDDELDFTDAVLSDVLRCEMRKRDRNNIVMRLLHSGPHAWRVDLFRNGELVARGDEGRDRIAFLRFHRWRGPPDRWSGNHKIDYQARRFGNWPRPDFIYDLADLPAGGVIVQGTTTEDITILTLRYVNSEHIKRRLRLRYARIEPLERILSDVSCLVKEFVG